MATPILCPTIVDPISADAWVGGSVSTLNADFSALQVELCNAYNIFPVGTILYYSKANFVPTGWLVADGRYVSKTVYSSLYSVISGIYGLDQPTMFKLPDCRDACHIGVGSGTGLTNRTLAEKGGLENVTLTVNQIAAHSHTATGSHTHAGSVVNAHSHTLQDPHHIHTVNDIGHTHSVYYGISQDTTQTQPVSVDYYGNLTTASNNPGELTPTQDQIDWGAQYARIGTSTYQDRHEIGAYSLAGVLHSTTPNSYWLVPYNVGGPRLMVGGNGTQSHATSASGGHAWNALPVGTFDPDPRINAIDGALASTTVAGQYIGLEYSIATDTGVDPTTKTYLINNLIPYLNVNTNPSRWAPGTLDDTYRTGSTGSLNGDPVVWQTYVNVSGGEGGNILAYGGCTYQDVGGCDPDVMEPGLYQRLENRIAAMPWSAQTKAEAHALNLIFRDCDITAPGFVITYGPPCYLNFHSTSEAGGTYTPPGTNRVWNWEVVNDYEAEGSGWYHGWYFNRSISIDAPSVVAGVDAWATVSYTLTSLVSAGSAVNFWIDPVDAYTTANPLQVTIKSADPGFPRFTDPQETGIILHDATLVPTISSNTTGVSIASRGGDAHSNMMPFLTLIPLIKALP